MIPGKLTAAVALLALCLGLWAGSAWEKGRMAIAQIAALKAQQTADRKTINDLATTANALRQHAVDERYIPFLPSVIEDPFEIWIGFAKNELTGQVYLRRRYAKAIRIGRNKYLSMMFDAIDGKWVSFNAIVGNSPSNGMREGMLIWARP